MYADKRCRLICDNSTRWGSTFIMLTSFINAKNRGVDFGARLNFKQIEIFNQILLPLYRLNLIFQCNDSTIGIVIPILLHTIHENLEAFNIKQDSNYDKFRISLINFLKHKFSFELNSSIYLVASLFNTEELQDWYDKPLV